jgi:hypothetical protein
VLVVAVERPSPGDIRPWREFARGALRDYLDEADTPDGALARELNGLGVKVARFDDPRHLELLATELELIKAGRTRVRGRH